MEMQISLFAEETQLERLSRLGDSLERLKIIEFEKFRPTLIEGLKKERKSNAGCPSYDSVMMFKVLVLQHNPHKLAQKDTDARWTKKGDETHSVTSANVHDSNEFEDFLTKTTSQPMQIVHMWAKNCLKMSETRSAKKVTAIIR